MGYWPRSMKRKRHNWITELGRKLVLIGCTGHYETISVHPYITRIGRKLYVVNAPGYEDEKAWTNGAVQRTGWSEDSVTVKGAKMMEII